MTNVLILFFFMWLVAISGIVIYFCAPIKRKILATGDLLLAELAPVMVMIVVIMRCFKLFSKRGDE